VPDFVEELEGETVQTAHTPNITVTIESSLVGLAIRQRQVGRRWVPGSARPSRQVELIDLIGRVKEVAIIWQVAA